MIFEIKELNLSFCSLMVTEVSDPKMTRQAEVDTCPIV